MAFLSKCGIISIIFFTLKVAYGRLGGFDLFASNMQLKILWENEIRFVELLETVNNKWTNNPKSFDM